MFQKHNIKKKHFVIKTINHQTLNKMNSYSSKDWKDISCGA